MVYLFSAQAILQCARESRRGRGLGSENACGVMDEFGVGENWPGTNCAPVLKLLAEERFEEV